MFYLEHFHVVFVCLNYAPVNINSHTPGHILYFTILCSNMCYLSNTLTCAFDLFSTRAVDMSGVISFNKRKKLHDPGVWGILQL